MSWLNAQIVYWSSLLLIAYALPTELSNITSASVDKHVHQRNHFTNSNVSNLTDLSNDTTNVYRLSRVDAPWVKRQDGYAITIDNYIQSEVTAVQAQLAVAAFNFVLTQKIARMTNINDDFPEQQITTFNHGVQFELYPGLPVAGLPVRPITGHEIQILAGLLWNWVDAFSLQETLPSATVNMFRMSDGTTVAYGIVLCGLSQPSPLDETRARSLDNQQDQKRSFPARGNLNNGTKGDRNLMTGSGPNCTSLGQSESPYIYEGEEFRTKIFNESPAVVTGFAMSTFLIDMLGRNMEEVLQYGNDHADNIYHEPYYEIEDSFISLVLKPIEPHYLTYSHIFAVNEALRGWCPPGILETIAGVHIRLFDVHTEDEIVEGNLLPLWFSNSTISEITRRDLPAIGSPLENNLTTVRDLSKSIGVPDDPYTEETAGWVLKITDYTQPYTYTASFISFLSRFETDLGNTTKYPVDGPTTRVPDGIISFSSHDIYIELYEMQEGTLTQVLMVYVLSFLDDWGDPPGLPQHGTPYKMVPSATISIALRRQPDVPIVKGILRSYNFQSTGPANESTTSLNDSQPLAPVPPDPSTTFDSGHVIVLSDYHQPFTSLSELFDFTESLQNDFGPGGRGKDQTDDDRLLDGHIAWDYAAGHFEIMEHNGGVLTWGIAEKVVTAMTRWGVQTHRAGALIPGFQFSVSKISSIGVSIVTGSVEFGGLAAVGGLNGTRGHGRVFNSTRLSSDGPGRGLNVSVFR